MQSAKMQVLYKGELMNTVLLLKLFTDVLKENLKGKQYSYRIDANIPVPNESLELWRKRGYEPSAIGTAYVKFDGKDKEYSYPAYFWSE